MHDVPGIRNIPGARRFSKYISLTFKHVLSTSNQSSLRDLTTRHLPLTYDYLTPQSSHLLNLSLVDILPDIFPTSSTKNDDSRTLPSIWPPRLMPAGHHL